MKIILAVLLLPLTTVIATNPGIDDYCTKQADKDCANVAYPRANIQRGWTARFNLCRCREWYFPPAHQSCVEGCTISYMNGDNPIDAAGANTICHRVCDPNPTCRDPGPCE